MKYLLLLFLLTGCGLFVTGEGKTDARLIDVSWEGVFYKSCEMDFQYGEQSSTIAKGSSQSKEFCSKAASLVGKNVRLQYEMFAHPCCISTDSNNIVTEITEQ